jgi:hypothetical protein
MKLTYPNFAAAIGAFVAAEAQATLLKPETLLKAHGPVNDPAGGPWAGVAFEDHLNGMLSDVIDLCSGGVRDRQAPCTLVIEEAPDFSRFEWQRCTCGYVRIEQRA